MLSNVSVSQVNNLIMWLRQSCSLEQFERFIELIEETAGQGGPAHDELAAVLREKLKNFRNNVNSNVPCKLLLALH
jgi:hypothetical protein